MKNIFNKCALFIAKYSFYLVAILYSLANIFFTVNRLKFGNQENIYLFGITFVHVFLLVLMLLVLYYLYKKDFYNVSEKKLLIILCILSALVSIYWIFSNEIKLIAKTDDYYTFYSALNIGSGDYTPLDYKSYLNLYTNNLSLMTYFLFFTKLFGESATTAIRLVNIIYMLIGYYSIYNIVKLLFNNRKINILVISLLFINFQFPFFTYVCYGNCPSYACELLSVYCLLKFIKFEKKRHIIISFISIMLAIICRQNSLIVLIAEIIVLFINFINTKKLITILTIILLICGQWLCIEGIKKYWEFKSNNNYDNSLPMECWIAYGLNYSKDFPGQVYHEFEVFHKEHDFDKESTKNLAIERINSILNDFGNDPLLIPEFLGRKLLVGMANPQYGVFNYEQYYEIEINEINTSTIKGNINKVISEIWDVGSSIIAIGLIAYIVFRRKEMTINELLCGIVVIGGMLFHTFWELKAIYMYQYFLFLFPYAAYGLSKIFDKCNLKANKL